MNTSQAIEFIEEEMPATDERDEIVTFVRESPRGIIKRYTKGSADDDSLSDAGKRYNRDWIFRHLTYTFEAGKSYAITGPNGSGKSTLLQAIGGALHLNEGSIQFPSQ